MTKQSSWTCARCGNENSKRNIRCSLCNSVNERRINAILDLERKVVQNPDEGKMCQCGTLVPDDVKKCPYCGLSGVDNFKKINIRGRSEELETPSTKLLHLRNHKLTKKDNCSRINTKSKTSHITTCSACGHQISIKAETCPSCGDPTGVHVCPKCQSINTKAISGASKAGSILLWGVFAANKVVSKFECKDCGHKW